MLQIAPRKLTRMVPEASELDRFEIASRPELAAWQREKLRETLHHAYANVPHYRAAFDQAGVHPRDFSDLPKKMRSLLKPSNFLSTRKIADNARQTFRERYLTPAAEACYWRSLIRGWAGVQTFEVQGWKEKMVEDPTTGRMKVKRTMRGAPFEAYAIMEEVEWEVPAKARKMCIDE